MINLLGKKGNLKFRAFVRTILNLSIIIISCVLVYIFAILGMLPGIIILTALFLVFVMYDANKVQIQHEDKLDEILKDKDKA